MSNLKSEVYIMSFYFTGVNSNHRRGLCEQAIVAVDYIGSIVLRGIASLPSRLCHLFYGLFLFLRAVCFKQ